MSELKYLDKMGTFTLDNPDLTSYMYFPLALSWTRIHFYWNRLAVKTYIITSQQEIFGFMLMEKVPGQPQDVLLSSRLSFLMMTRSR